MKKHLVWRCVVGVAVLLASRVEASAQVVSGVTPTSGTTRGGTELTLTGSGFGSAMGSVLVGGSGCAPSAWGDVRVLCNTPEGEGANLPVDLATSDGSAARWTGGTFSYTPPDITSVAPDTGSSAGGTLITITGSNFGTSTASRVNVGGAPCVIQAIDHGQITCLTPAGNGTVALRVQVGGQASNTVSFTYLPTLTVTGVNPAQGSTRGGTRLTIEGTNFVTGSSATIGTATCTDPLVSSGSVLCSSPEGVGAGLDVAVSAPDGRVGIMRGGFSYLPPSVFGINPSRSSTAGGSLITITGENFGASGARVTMGTGDCVVDSQDHELIVCAAPAGAGTGLPVRVTSGNQVSSLSVSFSYDAPSLDSVTPDLGTTRGGDVITIMGANFGPASSSVTVDVDGNVCGDVTLLDHTVLTCTAPMGQGTRQVRATVAGQSSSVLAASHRAPTVTGVEASSMPTRGGTPLTIRGDSFGQARGSVTIDGASCPVVTQDHELIVCTLPEGQGADVALQVDVDQLLGSTFAVSYEAPVITGVTPASTRTAGGATLTIQGRNFGTQPRAAVGGVDCPVTLSSHVSVECTAPEGFGTGVAVVVSAGNQVSAPAAVDYLPPIIEGVTPAEASTAGGIMLTVTGDNFGGEGAKVTVGGKPCVPQSQTHTHVICMVPEGSPGPAAVVVSVGGQASSAGEFTYVGPALFRLVPSELPEEGGVLTLVGSGFTADAVVHVGSTTCPVVGADGNTLVCVMGSGRGSDDAFICVDAKCSNSVPISFYGTCGNSLGDGEECNTGNPCMGRGRCEGTQCAGAAPQGEGGVCQPSTPCRDEGSCAAGSCEGAPAREGLACNLDGESCSSGECVPSGGASSSSSSGGVASSASSSGAASSGSASSSGGGGSSGLATSSAAASSSAAVASAAAASSAAQGASGGASTASSSASNTASSAGSSGQGSSSGVTSSSSAASSTAVVSSSAAVSSSVGVSSSASTSSASASTSSGGGNASSSAATSDGGGGDGGDSGGGPCACATPGASWPGLGMAAFLWAFAVRRRRS